MRLRAALLLLLAPLLLCAQDKPGPAQAEQEELSNALAESGSSPVEFIRALEKHLAKYPKTTRRNELERALVKAAIETKDNRRIILYGERVLTRDADDLQVLDRVTRALLASDAKDTSERALNYAKHYEALVAQMRSGNAPGGATQGQWLEELDRGMARALALESRALGNLGRMDEAVSAARRGYSAWPNAESAREIARWLERSGHTQEAIAPLADAFAIPDPKATDAERARDRARLGELYRKLNGSEKGLGDLVLEAYDRTNGQLAAHRLSLRQSDPNAQLTKAMDFTLSGVDGGKLELPSLRGKTLVFDFWATWCGPCRVQHPLYEDVKKKFHDSPDIVFLSINTDEDRTNVLAFLQENDWKQKVWYEDGLVRALQISSIPTAIVIDKRGQVVSRLNGFVPERFVDMLAERIRDAQRD